MLKKIVNKIQDFKSFRNSYQIQKNIYAIYEWRTKNKSPRLSDLEFWLGNL
jgi:hypothetical protein